jgi:hypothetical protein
MTPQKNNTSPTSRCILTIYLCTSVVLVLAHQNHSRYLLDVLCRLEKEPVTVSPSGPAGARFIIKLSLQRSPTALREFHGDEMLEGKQAVKLLRSLEYHVSVVEKRGHEAFWLALPVSCDHVNPLRGAAGA